MGDSALKHERWLKNRQLAEVLVEGKIPQKVVCDCGSPSVPRNHERAALIAEVPELIHFVEACEKHGVVVEKSGEKEFHIRLKYTAWIRLLKSLEKAGIRESAEVSV